MLSLKNARSLMKLIDVLNKLETIGNKIYRRAVVASYLLKKAIARPKYIWLGLWAFKQLWWVDRDIQQKAIAALQTPPKDSLPPLDTDIKKAIKERAIAIWWTSKIHPLRPKCLHRSLALYHWLLDRGISSKLEVGWGDNIGHAWITYDAIVLNDRPDVAESMTPFTRVQTEN